MVYGGDGWMWHSGWGGWGLMAVSMAVFWAVVVVLVFLAIRYLASDRTVTPGPPPDPAETLLAERYARGEIDDDEYRQRLALLRGHR